jgi:putative DNA primase/helicase
MILSNELPRFRDDTGVIATRRIVLETTESFEGPEDTKLLATLCEEPPGILNWAVEGWRELEKRGRFAPPVSEANE